MARSEPDCQTTVCSISNSETVSQCQKVAKVLPAALPKVSSFISACVAWQQRRQKQVGFSLCSTAMA
eukprot:3252424-Rhodomonas_salina.2